MPDTMLISVIVPAYNSGRTITDCINSIAQQDYRNVEILIVNDGSTDETPSLAAELASKDSRIRLISTENRGLSHARNTGLANAHGDLIAFLDSDDQLLDNTLSALFKCLVETGSDLVCGGYILVNSENGRETKGCPHAGTGLNKESGHRYFLTEGLNLSHAWGKLYKKELFRNVSYPEGRLYEDISVITSIVENSSSISITDIPIVRYFQNNTSLSQTPDISRQSDGLNARLDNYSFYREYYPGLSALAADAVVYYGYYLLGKIVRSGLKKNRAHYDRTISIIREAKKHSANHTNYLKTAGILFSISPLLFAHICRFHSFIKNGL